MARTEVRIAGFGGQGVVLAGVLLGTAAVLHDSKHAVHSIVLKAILSKDPETARKAMKDDIRAVRMAANL